MKKQNSSRIIWYGNILNTTIVGTLNITDSRRIFKQLKSQIGVRAGAPWANLIDVQQWTLSAVDIDEILIEMEIWAKKAGRTHLVFVIGTEHAELKKFALKKLLGNNLLKKEIQLVETLAQGITWLTHQGFNAKNVGQSTVSLPEPH